LDSNSDDKGDDGDLTVARGDESGEAIVAGGYQLIESLLYKPFGDGRFPLDWIPCPLLVDIQNCD
jgi:hypothetical protein